MKVNYVLMYGIPYVRYKEFETFEDISKFLVHKGYVNYSIFKKLEDKEEIEMIYRDNDIHYLENFVKEQDKEIERLNNKVEELMTLYTTEREVKEDYKSIIKEVREYIEDNSFLDWTLGINTELGELKLRQKELLEILDKGE